MNTERPRIHGLFSTVITIILSVAATLIMVSVINGGTVFFPASPDNREAVEALGEVVSSIKSEFYGELPNDETLVNAASKGMVSTLNDPYAQYFTASEYDSYRRDINGSYSGLGVLISVPDENGALITEVYEDSPAETAGIISGDIVTHVDGVSVIGMDMSALSNALSGEIGDVLQITILRNDETMELSVTLGEVIVHNVHYEMIDTTGYIIIDMFSESAPNDFDNAIASLKNDGMNSLIIDLRDNPGGSLNSVIRIADSILNEGVIVSIGKSMDDRDLITYEAEDGGIGVPIAVLVNGNSASASEILAAAITENNVGAVIGTQTYGKGIVQTSMPMEYGSWLKLTTDAYFTPDGNNIHGFGVTPDIEVTPPEGGITDRNGDIQLWTAIDYVLMQLEQNAISQ